MRLPAAGTAPAAAVAQAAGDGVHVEGHQHCDDDNVLDCHTRHLRGSRSPRGERRCRVCPAPPCDQQYGVRPRARAQQRTKPCSRVGREGRAERERVPTRASHPALNHRVRTANGRYQPPNGESHAAQNAPDPPTPRKDEKTVSHMTPQAGVVICTSPDKLRPPLDVCLRSTRSFWSRARARWASRR